MKFRPIPATTGCILFINAFTASFLKLFDLVLGMLIVCTNPGISNVRESPFMQQQSFRMVNSGKTSVAEAARLFGLHRSSVLD
jgi:hypothetical protein